MLLLFAANFTSITMANVSVFPITCGHVAVFVENCIIVFGGYGENDEQHSLRNIWMYNCYTEQWAKRVIPDEKMAPPGTSDTCAVLIEADIYMFGGYVKEVNKDTNEVWKLTRPSKQYFEWIKVKAKSKERTPSPRSCHSGWEYAGQLWTFGGYGAAFMDYLSDHGEFTFGRNNQLLCFDPPLEKWRNPKTFGTIPGPHSNQATTLTGDKVWLFRGEDSVFQSYGDFYQLDMNSLTWTEMKTNHAKSHIQVRCHFSWNAVSAHYLVLHDGAPLRTWSPNDTWILDLESLSWRQFTSSRNRRRHGHTGSTTGNGSVIVIGGDRFDCFDEDEESHATQMQVYNNVIMVRLEPKRLQHLATQKVYQHRDILPWKLLPKQLKLLLMFPVIV